jgi:hypothetical protein
LARQLLCMGWDVEAFDPSKSDRITTRSKKLAFDRLRSLYIGNGRLLKDVELVDGFVDFSSDGHYTIETVTASTGLEVRVTDRRQRKVAVVPNEMLQNATVGYRPKDIKLNFSYGGAYIDLPDGSSLALSNLFPKVRRVLAKKLSDELKAVATGGKASPPKTGQQKEGKGGAAGARGDASDELSEKADEKASAPGRRQRKRVSTGSPSPEAAPLASKPRTASVADSAEELPAFGKADEVPPPSPPLENSE